METRGACFGHKKTSQGEVVQLLTMRVAGLAMMWRAKPRVPDMGGKTCSLMRSNRYSPNNETLRTNIAQTDSLVIRNYFGSQKVSEK